MVQPATVQQSLTIFLALLPGLRGLHVTHRRILKLIVRYCLRPDANSKGQETQVTKRYKRPTVRRRVGGSEAPSGAVAGKASASVIPSREGGGPSSVPCSTGRDREGVNKSLSREADALAGTSGEIGAGHKSGGQDSSVNKVNVDFDSDSDDWDVPGSTVKMKQDAERHIRYLDRTGT